MSRTIVTRSRTRQETPATIEEEEVQQLISTSRHVLDDSEPTLNTGTFRIPNPALQTPPAEAESISAAPHGRGQPNDPDDDPDDEDPDEPDEPDDNNPGDNNPGDNDNNTGDDRLADALESLGRGIQQLRPSQVKLREPDTFDGKDPHKLREFLVSCNLIFLDRPESFRTNAKKIRYILSYLRGPALGLFEPYILDPTNSAPFMRSFRLFIQKLESNFGPYDQEADAEVAIQNLEMKENHRINRYIVDFTKHAARLSWNEPALRDKFYRDLPLRIRTELLRGGKPTTLAATRLRAQECDQAYWLIKEESSKEKQSSPKPNDSPKASTSSTNSDSNSPAPRHNKPPKQHHNHNSNSQSTSNSASSSSVSSAPRPPKPTGGSHFNSQPRQSSLSDKLGNNGKLTSEERERRMRESLCLYCGLAGHTAKDCRKSAKSKARSAKVESPPASTASAPPAPAEPKN